jgi:hypothetical protein
MKVGHGGAQLSSQLCKILFEKYLKQKGLQAWFKWMMP